MNYRPEIDGLRALAVGVILIFHFFPEYLRLGFLGVDIFFVISGYLISSQILQKKQEGSFSFADFYTRRIKRILPASVVLIALVTLVASQVLLRTDFDRYYPSAIASMTFWANIFFWRDGGYFGGNDELKPLLHMWSLSVEEQFYLFLPMALLATITVFGSSRLRFAIVATASLASLSLLIYMTSIGGANPAFFLLPTRVWQFGLGCLVAIVAAERSPPFRNQLNLLAVAAVFVGLLAPLTHLTAGLIVTFATAAFIHTASRGALVTHAFSWEPVRKVGRISFSLYLYHWPVIVFLKYALVDEVTFVHRLMGIAISTVLAIISYKFIEIPFRHKLSFRSVLLLIFGAAVVIISLGLVRPVANNSMINKMASATNTHFRCPVSAYRSFGASRACLIGAEDRNYSVALLGNSHAQMYAPLIDTILRKAGTGGILVPLNGCLPTLDINLSRTCAEQALVNFNTVASDNRIDTVVVAMTWYQDTYWTADAASHTDPAHQLALGVLKLATAFRSRDKNVIVVGPIQIPGTDLGSELSRKMKFGALTETEALNLSKVSRTGFDERFKKANDLLQMELGDHYIEPAESFCDDKDCHFGRSEGYYFSDSNHLSDFGISHLQKDLAEKIESVVYPAQ